MTPTLYSSQKKSKELTVYTRRRNRRNFFAVPNFGLDTIASKDQRRALPFLLSAASVDLPLPAQDVMIIWERDLFGC